MTQLDLQQRLEQAEDRVKALENIQLANLEVKLNLAERAKKAEAECYELQQQVDEYSLILDGLPKDAIDGGWTAKGISDYAAKMERRAEMAEAELARLKAQGFTVEGE